MDPVCKHRGKSPCPDRHRHLPVWLLPLAGLLALIWFLCRVLPKPERVAYPCQRVAAPLAGGFLLWLGGLLGSVLAYGQARRFWRQSRWALACLCVGIAAAVGVGTLVVLPERPALADSQAANDPLGVALGVQPGRVVWIHDPDATDWAGPGYGHWWESDHTSQEAVDRMMSAALRALSGTSSDAAAWDALIHHHNLTHGKGDVGYAPGERIVIKTNFVGCHYLWGGVDPVSYDLVSMLDYMNTSPQMIVALLRQLVNVVGVAQTDLAVGDPQGLFPNQYYDICHGEFPDVSYLDHDGGNAGHPRTLAQFSSVPFHWSSHPTGMTQDYLPTCFVEAEYFVNLANFKSHSLAGVTLGAKNHYGSLIRIPVADGYYDMHLSLASEIPAAGSYRALVDLLGHADLGGKTLLYLVDGLYSGVHPDDSSPRHWAFPPFNGDWTSSLFAAQDPVALESVCLDLMQEEGDPRSYPQMAGADDHLHEAALADDPPSGTFYDPDHAGDVERLASLGVHEHWNNSTDMQYTRNLGTGDGIELIRVDLPTAVGEIGPERLALRNFPNPFNPRTTISFELPIASPVCLIVYGVDGRPVRTLLDATLPAGLQTIVWDGRDDNMRPLAAGVYICRLTAGGWSGIQRLVMVK